MFKFTEKFRTFFKKTEISPEYWSELEEMLLGADVGLEVTAKLIDSLRGSKNADEIKIKLRTVVSEMIKTHKIVAQRRPHVIMVVGVNGSGKTTTIAKIAKKYKEKGKSVMLVAADTFRAAAVDQLQIWGDRIGAPVVAQTTGSDSAAVSFDGVKSAIAKNIDVVLVDTAGRLHTNKNLMDELTKVKRVIGKAMADAPHDILLVLDSTIGQNGLNQAKVFNESLGLTSVALTKMDGTAKGGIILSVGSELGLPISFVGTGEAVDKIEEFSVEHFVNSLFS